jgi:hypothetical protein
VARPVAGARWRRKARGSAQHPIIRISRQCRHKNRGVGTFLWFSSLAVVLSREASEISPSDPTSWVRWSAAAGIRPRPSGMGFQHSMPFASAKKRKMIVFVDASVRANSCCSNDPFSNRRLTPYPCLPSSVSAKLNTPIEMQVRARPYVKAIRMNEYRRTDVHVYKVALIAQLRCPKNMLHPASIAHGHCWA